VNMMLCAYIMYYMRQLPFVCQGNTSITHMCSQVLEDTKNITYANLINFRTPFKIDVVS